MIFDLDGTTLYTLDDISESFNQALKEFGFPEKDKEAIRMGVGRGFRMLVNNIVPEETPEELKDRLALRYKAIYAERYAEKTRPYEGMEETLKALQEEGIQMAVNSNKSDIFVKGLIGKNFPDVAFSDVLGSIEGIALKPDPEAAYRIIAKMGLKKEEVAYVGDSDIDMKTAKNAGMKAVGCLWGYRDRKTLEESGADLLIGKPEELLKLIKEETI